MRQFCLKRKNLDAPSSGSQLGSQSPPRSGAQLTSWSRQDVMCTESVHITIFSYLRMKSSFSKMTTFFGQIARCATFSMHYFWFFGVRWRGSSGVRGKSGPLFQLYRDSRSVKYWSEHEFSSKHYLFWTRFQIYSDRFRKTQRYERFQKLRKIKYVYI